MTTPRSFAGVAQVLPARNIGVVAALVALLIAACENYPPSPEIDAARSRAMLEGVAGPASQIIQIEFREGMRIVVTDVELLPDGYCFRPLASRSYTTISDFWEDVHREAADSISCNRYMNISRVSVGDPRTPK